MNSWRPLHNIQLFPSHFGSHKAYIPSLLRAMSSSSRASVPEDTYGHFARPSQEREADIVARIGAVRGDVSKATDVSRSHGWRTDEPRLVAVSKLHPPSAIMAAYAKAGQRHFGENYVQELLDKSHVLPREIQWHFIGALQSNKAKSLAAVPNLFAVETLESSKAADQLEKCLSQNPSVRDTPLRVFIQVNTSGEENKAGLPPLIGSDASTTAASPVYALAKHLISKCPHLLFAGVMTIGSFAHSKAAEADLASAKDDPQGSRKAIVDANPDFATLLDTRTHLVQALRDDSQLAGSIHTAASQPTSTDEKYNTAKLYASILFSSSSTDPSGGLELSMGMSNDLDVAIMAGSTNVRVGTECFGTRPPTRQEAMDLMEHELHPTSTPPSH